MRPFTLCVCASGGGGNFQALLDVQQTHGYAISTLIVDRECGAGRRAHDQGVAVVHLDRTSLGEQFFQHLDAAIPADTDLVVLAGFMPILPAWLCEKWHRKIINTHPSLLPAYGGKGMYGVKVQEAVLAHNEEYAGCTVHYVTEVIDGGDIILTKTIKVNSNESAWDLGGRIFREENRLLPQAVRIVMKEKGFA